ncbi:signal peptide peptidase-domain-containing protein [Mycena vitilis]|nr:signal peptide peptidase-domain-containing protein [Mycena vitilis]
MSVDYDLLSSYAGLLSLATVSIYLGAHGSLPPPRNADGTRSEEEEVPERMSSGDAYLFPVIGSATLVGMYAVVKYFGTAWINMFLGWYFSFMGVGAVWKSSIALARWAFGDVRWKAFDEVALVVRKGADAKSAPLVELGLRTPSLALLPLAIMPSALYTFYARSALLTDVLGLAFAQNALALLKIDSFQTGCILLAGLFFYDVWWVFGTEVVSRCFLRAKSADDVAKRNHALVPQTRVYARAKMTDANSNMPADGQGRDVAGRAHQAALAQVAGVCKRARVHDAGAGGRGGAGYFHRAGAAVRPPPRRCTRALAVWQAWLRRWVSW